MSEKALFFVQQALAVEIKQESTDQGLIVKIPRSEFMKIHDALHYARDALATDNRAEAFNELMDGDQ